MKAIDALYHSPVYEALERGEGKLSEFVRIIAGTLAPILNHPNEVELARQLTKVLTSDSLARAFCVRRDLRRTTFQRFARHRIQSSTSRWSN